MSIFSYSTVRDRESICEIVQENILLGAVLTTVLTPVTETRNGARNYHVVSWSSLSKHQVHENKSQVCSSASNISVKQVEKKTQLLENGPISMQHKTHIY